MPSEFRSVLEKMGQSVSQRGARLLVLVWPLSIQVAAETPKYTAWQLQQFDFAHQHDVAILDLLPIMKSQLGKYTLDELYLDLGHPNVAANIEIGSVVAERLADMAAEARGSVTN